MKDFRKNHYLFKDHEGVHALTAEHCGDYWTPACGEMMPVSGLADYKPTTEPISCPHCKSVVASRARQLKRYRAKLKNRILNQ